MCAATHEASSSISISCSMRCVDQCDPVCGRITLAPYVLRESCMLCCVLISHKHAYVVIGERCVDMSRLERVHGHACGRHQHSGNLTQSAPVAPCFQAGHGRACRRLPRLAKIRDGQRRKPFVRPVGSIVPAGMGAPRSREVVVTRRAWGCHSAVQDEHNRDMPLGEREQGRARSPCGRRG